MSLNDVKIDDILGFNTLSYNIKYYITLCQKNYKFFIGYFDEDKIKTFSVILPKAKVYVKSYIAETKWMFFSNEDGELLEKFVDIWNKVSGSMKEGLDS